MTRALKAAKGKLEQAGIKVIDWEPYKSMEILETIVCHHITDNSIRD